jgi:hypothetical protein
MRLTLLGGEGRASNAPRGYGPAQTEETDDAQVLPPRLDEPYRCCPGLRAPCHFGYRCYHQDRPRRCARRRPGHQFGLNRRKLLLTGAQPRGWQQCRPHLPTRLPAGFVIPFPIRTLFAIVPR